MEPPRLPMPMPPELIASLPSGPLDVVGDVHGEIEALMSLVSALGYDAQGRHPRHRLLVFIGDLCDRGPDSPAVVDWVMQRHREGRALVVLGNHELNLLRGLRKDGNDWYWGDIGADGRRYEPFALLAPHRCSKVLDFFDRLPVALERPDLRLVHAAWHAASVDRLRGLRGPVSAEYRRLEQAFRAQPEHQRLAQEASEQREALAGGLHDVQTRPPPMPLIARWEALRQMGHPIRVLTSGVEHPTGEPFYAGGSWRFVQRASWWDSYLDPVPVLVGHYWRRAPAAADRPAAKRTAETLFEGVSALRWHGASGQVFCIDFSVGARFLERQQGRRTGFEGRLAALRWPERSLCFDDGETCATEGYGGLRP